MKLYLDYTSTMAKCNDNGQVILDLKNKVKNLEELETIAKSIWEGDAYYEYSGKITSLCIYMTSYYKFSYTFNVRLKVYLNTIYQIDRNYSCKKISLL